MTGALAALKALPERARGRIYAKINALADAPRPRGSKMPEDAILTVRVLRMGARGDVYRNLGELWSRGALSRGPGSLTPPGTRAR